MPEFSPVLTTRTTTFAPWTSIADAKAGGTAIKDGFAVRAILPRPEGRGLPRKLIKPAPQEDSPMKPRIAMVLGDPAGIGPELIARLLSDPEARKQADVLLIADRDEIELG